MPAEERTKLVTEIHATPFMVVIVITGGGARALADLSSVPGASRTLLEARIPYCARALAEFLECSPLQAVSVETAAGLGRRAFERARRLMPEPGVPVIGVSCTAALVTDRPKKGLHRLHVGVSWGDGSRVYSLNLTKGARTREREERVAADLVLQAIAHAMGVHFPLDLGLLDEEEVRITDSPPAV
jgi:hypothetical protein